MTEPTLRDCINYMKQQLKGMEKYTKSYEFNIPYYRKTIELLEEQRPHGEWVPCSERLPDVGQEIYLVTIDYGDGLSCVAPRFFFNEEIGWNEAEEYITAWMPSPKPYKEEGDSDA